MNVSRVTSIHGTYWEKYATSTTIIPLSRLRETSQIVTGTASSPTHQTAGLPIETILDTMPSGSKA
ncbi:hypothetical protein D3C86_2203600 [compost metagenome]